jgi:CHAT domain-containing protein
MLQAGLDLHKRQTLRALKRREDAQKTLASHPLYPEATDLRFNAHIDQAGIYLLVAQFTQADAQLDAAERILPSVGTQARNVASLKNARAAVLIEKATLAIEDAAAAPDVLASLNAAEKHLDQALSLLEKADDGEGVLSATAQFQLALVHELRGRTFEVGKKPNEAQAEFKAGLQVCEKALQSRRKTLPANHVVVLETRTLRAWLNLRMGDADAAQKEGLDSLKKYDETHPRNDIDRGRYLHVLIEAENRLKHTERARQYADEHRHLVDAGLSGLVAGLSAPDQIQFFRKWDHRALHASLRLGIQHADNAAVAESTVEWLINGKTRLTDVLAAQVQTAKAGERQEFAKFQKAVQRQALLLYGGSPVSASALETEFLREELRKRDAVEQAAIKFPLHLRWFTLSEVRKSLAADEVYIGVYSLRSRETAPRHYYAWAVAPQGPVQTIDLGDADRIDALVKIFQREQEKAPYLAPGEERKAEQELRRKCLSELSARVLQPIRMKLNGQKHWVVSPDGPLWNVPWAAMLLPESDRYAIEELTFRYAISGQDLVREKRALAPVGAPLVLGDPLFNYPGTNSLRLRKYGLDPLRIPFDRLEHSRLETDTIFSLMQNLKLMPTRLTGVVQKDQLFQLQDAPRVLYLSTHAYAPLPSQATVHDPLLSCALAFAGWNYLPPEGDALPGMMTGAELLSVNFRGTELVVLASCEAGSEQYALGQSPANLRHAFHLAGARAVVAALWPIHDRTSLDLMEPFMANASLPGSDKVSALQDAQKQTIRYLKLYRNHTHPFYWAGFTITGS